MMLLFGPWTQELEHNRNFSPILYDVDMMRKGRKKLSVHTVYRSLMSRNERKSRQQKIAASGNYLRDITIRIATMHWQTNCRL